MKHIEYTIPPSSVRGSKETAIHSQFRSSRDGGWIFPWGLCHPSLGRPKQWSCHNQPWPLIWEVPATVEQDKKNPKKGSRHAHTSIPTHFFSLSLQSSSTREGHCPPEGCVAFFWGGRGRGRIKIVVIFFASEQRVWGTNSKIKFWNHGRYCCLCSMAGMAPEVTKSNPRHVYWKESPI